MWQVYILKCADNTLYTGITNNLAKRLAAHNSGIASKYTRARLPVQLVFYEEQPDRSAATKRELEIKGFSTIKKHQLISENRDN